MLTDLSLLPPCKSTLPSHIQRINYQTLVWKQFLCAFPKLPPAEHHGWKLEDGQLCVHLGDNMFPAEIEDDLSTLNDDQEDCQSDSGVDEPIEDFTADLSDDSD